MQLLIAVFQERRRLFEVGDLEKNGTLSRDGITLVNEDMTKNDLYKRLGVRKDLSGRY